MNFVKIATEVSVCLPEPNSQILTHRLGITYNENMFYCVECHMNMCDTCYSCHDDKHIKQAVRVKLMQWMERLPKVEPTAECHHCAKESKIRWQCEQCKLALCRKCVGDWDRRKEFFKEHREQHPDHRAFLATYPPYWATAPTTINGDNCPCVDIEPSGIQHCERCAKSKLHVLCRG